MIEKTAASACWDLVLKPARCSFGDPDAPMQVSCAPPTVCSNDQLCKLPCITHDDCILTCGEDNYCTTISSDQDEYFSYDYQNNSYVSQCLKKYSSPLTMLFARRNVGLPGSIFEFIFFFFFFAQVLIDDASLQDLEIALFKDRIQESCVDDLNFRPLNTKEECESEWCNWKISCPRSDPNCNATCLPKPGEDTHFCGQTLPSGVIQPLTQHPYCAPANMLWGDTPGIPNFDNQISCPSGCGSTNTSKVIITSMVPFIISV